MNESQTANPNDPVEVVLGELLRGHTEPFIPTPREVRRALEAAELLEKKE